MLKICDSNLGLQYTSWRLNHNLPAAIIPEPIHLHDTPPFTRSSRLRARRRGGRRSQFSSLSSTKPSTSLPTAPDWVATCGPSNDPATAELTACPRCLALMQHTAGLSQLTAPAGRPIRPERRDTWRPAGGWAAGRLGGWAVRRLGGSSLAIVMYCSSASHQRFSDRPLIVSVVWLSNAPTS